MDQWVTVSMGPYFVSVLLVIYITKVQQLQVVNIFIPSQSSSESALCES